MPKPFPIPASLIYNNPGWMTADTLVKGALIAIILPWWLSGCEPIDLTLDANLQERTALGAMRWSRKRDSIKKSLTMLLPELTKAHSKLVISQQKLAIRNQIGSEALAEYRQKVFLQKKAIENVDVRLTEGLDDNRMDRVLPSKLPKPFVITPNSFKNRPPKPQGTLRDK